MKPNPFSQYIWSLCAKNADKSTGNTFKCLQLRKEWRDVNKEHPNGFYPFIHPNGLGLTT